MRMFRLVSRHTQRSLAAMLVLGLLASAVAGAQVPGTKLGPRPIQPPPAAAGPARLTLQDLTKQADIIAIGKVSEFRSDWNGARTRVFTRAILTTGEYVKGSQTLPTISITYQAVDTTPDAVRFQKDEEVFLFIRKDLQGNFQVVGGSQGKFVIGKDMRTAQKMVSAYTSLDDMKAQVTGYLKSAGRR